MKTGTGTAAAASPDVSFVGPDKVTLALTQSTCSRASNGERIPGFRGHVYLMVKNDGTAVKRFQITTFPDPTLRDPTSYNAPLDQPVTLDAFSVKALGIQFCVSDPRSRNATFALTILDPPGAKPATITIDLTRRATGQAYLETTIGAVAFAMLFVTLRLSLWAKGRTLKLRELRQHAMRPVYTAQTWSFSGSWATTVTALGAILATIFAASGFLDDVVPGVDVTRLLALDIVFGAVALAAPLVYSAASSSLWSVGESGERVQTVAGTIGGLALAVTLTLIGVGGQLGTMGLLVDLSDADPWFKGILYGVLSLAAFLVGWYAIVTMEQLRAAPRPKDARTPAAMI